MPDDYNTIFICRVVFPTRRLWKFYLSLQNFCSGQFSLYICSIYLLGEVEFGPKSQYMLIPYWFLTLISASSSSLDSPESRKCLSNPSKTQLLTYSAHSLYHVTALVVSLFTNNLSHCLQSELLVFVQLCMALQAGLPLKCYYLYFPFTIFTLPI